MMNNSDEPLIRVMALHALAYCERLFYLEEVEEIRLADASVYAGRTLHEELKHAEGEAGQWISMELVSEALGLVGKVDCIKRSDGSFVPYEHKRGRPRKENKAAKAWPSDALQVSAYGMLLEEEIGKKIAEGRIRYHAENVTVRVPLDGAARTAVKGAILRARELRQSTERPPVTTNDALCVRCALSPICLPEEDRLAADPAWEPVRLFPADREVKTIHVVEPGTRVGRSANTLKVEGSEGSRHVFPVNEVGSVVLHGHVQITTQAVHFCAGNGIPVHFVSGGGRYVGGVTPGAGSTHRKLRQYRALSDPSTCMRLARKLALAKVQSGLRYILRAKRGRAKKSQDFDGPLETLRTCLKHIARVDSLDVLRGYEGLAGRAYFSALPLLLKDEVPQEMRLAGRNRRPPKDRFNALLGFGYALVYQAVMQAIIAVGLEPVLGFFHTPRSSALPLALDLMELFRVALWDMTLVGSVNRLQWDPVADFAVSPGRVWLSDSGRKKAIGLFERRLEETWKHPVIGYSLSYARMIELEVRLLEKEWTGPPGLFARMRLR
jgi:CRISPR-associated protein Cas1